MAKRVFIQTDDDGEDLLLSKKAKRKLAKVAKAPVANSKVEPEEPPADDIMSRMALLCQDGCWREAALLCHQRMAAETADGQSESSFLEPVCRKIEKSLRRQMAAAFLSAAQRFLNQAKEAGESL